VEGANSFNNTFKGESFEVLNGPGAFASDSHFYDSASQLLYEGLSVDPIFNNKSHFFASGGGVVRLTLNDSALGILTGTAHGLDVFKINDRATLLVTAPGQIDPKARIQSIELNGGKLIILPSGNSSSVAENVAVGSIHVNHGTVAFGDARPQSGHYVGLNVDTIDGPGGTLVFNTSLASKTGNVLTAKSIGQGTYNLLLNDAVDSKALTLNTLVQASELKLFR